MNAVEKAFFELTAAAEHWSKNLGEEQAMKRLTSSAMDYATARWTAKSPPDTVLRRPPAQQASPPVFPFGDNKGKPLREVSEKDLEWLLGRLGRLVDDPAAEKYRARNLRLVDEARAELERRHRRGGP